MTDHTDYKTEPINSWNLLNEARRGHFSEIWQAHDNGEVLIMGTLQVVFSLFAGLGDFAWSNYSPYVTTMAKNHDVAIEAFEAFEAKGFGSDVCAFMACQLGQLFQGISTRSPSGKNVKPDFIFDFHWCPHTAKAAQVASQQLEGVPFFIFDVPYMESEHCIEYVIAQMHEAINWMQETTGRVYDDERFIKAVQSEWRCMTLWARICELNKAVPAPLSGRQMLSLSTALASRRYKEKVADAYETLLDEVEERVRNQISATGFERRRLLLEGGAPWTHPQILKRLDKYGVVLVGGESVFGLGAWTQMQDGKWQAAKTPEQRGIELRTREHAIRALAELVVKAFPVPSRYNLSGATEVYAKRAEDWRADAALFVYTRGCPDFITCGLPEAKLALQKKGIPTVTIEANVCDPRGVNENQIIDTLDSFMESQGLSQIAEN